MTTTYSEESPKNKYSDATVALKKACVHSSTALILEITLRQFSVCAPVDKLYEWVSGRLSNLSPCHTA